MLFLMVIEATTFFFSFDQGFSIEIHNVRILYIYYEYEKRGQVQIELTDCTKKISFQIISNFRRYLDNLIKKT